MKKQFLFLNAESKDGSSFILIIDKKRAYLATEYGEFECLDAQELIDEIYFDYLFGKVDLIGVV
jgi:hypothetical protein